MQFLQLEQIGFLTPLAQIILIGALFIITAVTQYKVFKKTGKLSGGYPVNTFLFLAPVYEEIIFRGVMLAGFIGLFSTVWAVVLTSILFGIWHIRTIFFAKKRVAIFQMASTGLILGPILALVTIVTGTIWIAVILHYINNLIGAALADKVLSFFARH